MEIIIHGSQPKLTVQLRASSTAEMRDVIDQLKKTINFYGSASIADLYDICGLPCSTMAYNHIGWNYKDINFIPITYSPGYYKWSGFSLKYCCTLPTTRENQDLCFKPAITKASKDDKIQKAYNVLTKAYCNEYSLGSDLHEALQEAIGYLGEVLE